MTDFENGNSLLIIPIYDDVFENVGKRNIERTLGLKTDSLDNLGNEDFTTFVGQTTIEQKLSIPGGYFSPGSLDEIIEAIGQD